MHGREARRTWHVARSTLQSPPLEDPMKRLTVALILLLLTTPRLRADNGAKAGNLIVEPPTLICLGFEWEVSGDDNRNATVDVSYRRSGQGAWLDGMPLLRMGGERIFRAP